jgi:hypothetical protein
VQLNNTDLQVVVVILEGMVRTEDGDTH